MKLIDRIEAAPSADFDYEQLDDATALEAKAVVERYRARTETYIFDTGRDLIAIKNRLDRGLFLKWVEAEMGLTARTAQNFMQAAARLGHKSEIVSHLPPTTLYKLSSPSIPELVREEIVERIEAGEPLSSRQIADRLWEAEQIAKREAAEAKITPEEHKRQTKRKRDAEIRHPRDMNQFQRERDEQDARNAANVKELAELLAARLDDESYSRAYHLLGECQPWDLRAALSKAYGPTKDQKAMAADTLGGQAPHRG